MSDFSLTLVLRLTTSKIINDVAKVQIKSEKITPIGGIFHVRELFSRFVAPIIDKVLGTRCTSFGYQYSEIVGSLASVYFCGGDCERSEERSEGQVIDLFFIKTCELHYLYVSLQRFCRIFKFIYPELA